MIDFPIMTSRLPQGDQAVLDIRKIDDYCLNPSHPRGRHKARVFREALGIERNDAQLLRGILLTAARDGEAMRVSEDRWGAQWRLDTTVQRHDKQAMIRSIWIIRTGENLPRFVTC